MNKLPTVKRVQATGLETVARSAKRKRIARQTVLRAIYDGRLPAYSATSNGESDIYLVNPADADALWGVRTEPLVHDPDLVFA